MGSNIQVEFMIGSLPLAVLTQRCTRTVELTGRRESKHLRRTKLLTNHAPAARVKRVVRQSSSATKILTDTIPTLR